MDVYAALEELHRRLGYVQVVVAHADGRADGWTAAVVTGREAADSPMAGGAAYGMGPTPHDALAEALADYRVELADGAVALDILRTAYALGYGHADNGAPCLVEDDHDALVTGPLCARVEGLLGGGDAPAPA